MSDTSNRESNGDFEDSWTQYWMTFSNEETLKCSVCETLHVDGKDADEPLAEYESQGGHVQLDGVIYITPLCFLHNKEDVGENIVLKAGSVLVEEVAPIILEE